VRGWHGLGSGSIADTQQYHPITEFHRQMDFHGKFTAAAGHALYTARAFPKEYWNRIAFITEGTGHLVQQDVLEPEGSGYRARDHYNFLASTDEWTAPTAAEVGPDGAVWVNDWYNYIFQHNPTPHGFETGKGNAYVTPLRDKTHGRVYRIVYDGSANAPKQQQPKRLDNATPEQLVAALGDDNLFWRMTAQRLLLERGKTDVVPALQKLVADTKLDAIGNAPAAIHALWALQGLKSLDGAVALGALKHPAPAVRKAALDTCPRDAASLAAILTGGLLNDADAQVRLAALLALSEMPASADAGKAVADVMRKAENASDRWIPDAATSAAARHGAGFLGTVLAVAREANGAKPQTAEVVNLIPNGSFEDVSGSMPAGWALHNWQGAADAALDEQSATSGRRALRLSAADVHAGADSSVSVVVPVRPRTMYRISASVRTRDVAKGSGMGALLNVHELQGAQRVATKPVTGTADWTRVQASFNSGKLAQITINCLLGGWGKSTGTAWFDDVRLEPLNEGKGVVVDSMMRVVTTHYAQGGPSAQSLAATLASAVGADDRAATALLEGLLAGWPRDGAPTPDATLDDALRRLSPAVSADNRALLVTLAQRLGRAELFAAETATAREELVASVADEKLDAAARAAAAKRLLSLADTPSSVEAILKLITPQCPPALAANLMSSIGDSGQDTTGGLVLKRWNTLPPAARKAAVDLLVRRGAWHAALLDAMEKGAVVRGDLTAEQAQQLVAVAPDPAAAARAKKLLAAGGRTPDANKQKVIDRMLPLADRRGAAAAGKAVFEKNCAVCHTFAGAGGRVGPDLSGIGKNPRREILINILDPNRSVEGNFKLWIIQTKDGQTMSGRLDAESQTTVELLDAAGKQHVVQRKDIKRMQSQPNSVMPEGFEMLPEKDLTDLLEFLAQPTTANVQ
jgi:putative heme-binding domain-containing protein